MSITKTDGVPGDLQFKLFGDMPCGLDKSLSKTASDSGRRFLSADPRAIYIGTTKLEEYLQQAKQSVAFTVADFLDREDWRAFEGRYASTGRAPYAPRQMLGLILYGVMHGVHSLRDLERMARLDLGCMWVTGGITPDHANIGRFITLHEESLTTDFFESLTGSILRATNSKSARLAGDGTVIEAACSYYKMLKAEAIKARAEAARTALEKKPNDRTAQEESIISAQCLEIFEERASARKRSGRSTDTLCISGVEPEAMVQRLKNGGGFAPAYKPSVLANENRIITAMALDPSSENKVVAEMLDQSARVVGVHADEALFDAGYFDDIVIATTLERDISLLCPEGLAPGVTKASKVYHKSSFQYESCTDTYRCPADQILILLKTCEATSSKRAYALYGTTACGDCASRANCTTTKQRQIQRHPEDTERDALRQVMQQRQVRSIFCQRKAMVEPVFSHLRGTQGLNRFRRKGLRAVKREFALHAMAYNLSRAVALLRAIFRLDFHPWPAFFALADDFCRTFRKFIGVFRELRLPSDPTTIIAI